jgi:hypothetical protein
MGLRGVFAAALPGIFDAAGEDAVYHPLAGPSVPCKIFIDFNVQLQASGAEMQIWERGTIIEALLSEVGAEPDAGSHFVYDGTSYCVRVITENDGLTVKVVVT